MQHAPGRLDGLVSGTGIASIFLERQRQSFLAPLGYLFTDRVNERLQLGTAHPRAFSVPSGAGLHMLAGPYSTVQTS